MPATSLLMLAAALAALGVIAWLGWKGRLSLEPAAARALAEPAADRPGARHATGAFLLIATVGVMLAASLGAGLGTAIVNAIEPTLGQQAAVQWIAVGIGVLAIAPIGMAWAPARDALGRGWSGFAGGVRWGVVAAALILPAVWGIGVLSTIAMRLITGSPPEPIAHQTLSAMMLAERDLGWWLMVSAVVLAAPLFEELLYRGFLQGGIHRTIHEMNTLHSVPPRPASAAPIGRHAWLAIIIGAAIFALLHAGVAAWIAMPSLLALGIALGWLRVRTGGLLAPIIVHAAFNAMNLVLASVMAAG